MANFDLAGVLSPSKKVTESLYLGDNGKPCQIYDLFRESFRQMYIAPQISQQWHQLKQVDIHCTAFLNFYQV